MSNQGMDREVVTARPAPLVPIAERRIPFHGDEIAAALVAGETGEPVIMVPVRPLCERLGLAWPPQYTRIQRDPVLRKAATSVTVTVTQGGRQRRTVLCLPADMLHGWLFGVSTGRVRPEYREALNLYRAECSAVLWRAYQAGELGAPAALAQVRATALAVAALAWPESVRALSQVSQPGDLDHTALIPQGPPRRKPGPSPHLPRTCECWVVKEYCWLVPGVRRGGPWRDIARRAIRTDAGHTLAALAEHTLLGYLLAKCRATRSYMWAIFAGVRISGASCLAVAGSPSAEGVVP